MDENWLATLIHRPGRVVQQVVFSPQAGGGQKATGMYQIYLSSEKLVPANVTCLYPLINGSDLNREIASASYKSYESFDNAVNKTLAQSRDTGGEVDAVNHKLVIKYGQHLYECVGLTGTVYIYQATYVNHTNAGQVTTVRYQNVPTLFNLDGMGKVKSIFILKEKVSHPADLLCIAITKHTPRLFFPKHARLFGCETKRVFQTDMQPTAGQSPLYMSIMTRQEALTAISNPIPLTATNASNDNPFAASVDYEVDVGYSTESGVDAGTPRSALYNSSGGAGGKEKDEDASPDPFKKIV
jgi:hypothetical protein